MSHACWAATDDARAYRRLHGRGSDAGDDGSCWMLCCARERGAWLLASIRLVGLALSVMRKASQAFEACGVRKLKAETTFS
jgi:hypothetical protein